MTFWRRVNDRFIGRNTGLFREMGGFSLQEFGAEIALLDFALVSLALLTELSDVPFL